MFNIRLHILRWSCSRFTQPNNEQLSPLLSTIIGDRRQVRAVIWPSAVRQAASRTRRNNKLQSRVEPLLRRFPVVILRPSTGFTVFSHDHTCSTAFEPSATCCDTVRQRSVQVCSCVPCGLCSCALVCVLYYYLIIGTVNRRAALHIILSFKHHVVCGKPVRTSAPPSFVHLISP